MVEQIGTDIPVIALTATATPKVQSDIIRNLNLVKFNKYISSFNRTNLFYEIRPKQKRQQTMKQIIQFIHRMKNPSGIIDVQNRKRTQMLADTLSMNGSKPAPYNAGLDATTRTMTQDAST